MRHSYYVRFLSRAITAMLEGVCAVGIKGENSMTLREFAIALVSEARDRVERMEFDGLGLSEAQERVLTKDLGNTHLLLDFCDELLDEMVSGYEAKSEERDARNYYTPEDLDMEVDDENYGQVVIREEDFYE